VENVQVDGLRHDGKLALEQALQGHGGGVS
jgi:hypothetical protein